jgi:hypothetical protein
MSATQWDDTGGRVAIAVWSTHMLDVSFDNV